MKKDKYPQSAESNEYRYLDYPWLNEVATGLTAGAEKHPEGARCTGTAPSLNVARG